MVAIKLCGLRQPEEVALAHRLAVEYIGLVFYPRSPRSLTLSQAKALREMAGPIGPKVVALVVDPSLDDLQQIQAEVAPDILQLHGQESPAFCQEVKQALGLPLIKAVPVAKVEDIAAAAIYEAADWLLFEAHPPKDGLPGGNQKTFDWSLLAQQTPPKPWFLAGGLTPDTVGTAIRQLNPPAVDVSSGIEGQRGVKDLAKIEAFVDACRANA